MFGRSSETLAKEGEHITKTSLPGLVDFPSLLFTLPFIAPDPTGVV